MATPTLIPVKSDKHQHAGVLGVMNNTMARKTELDALHPRRQRYERQYTFEPPMYTDAQGVRRAYVWCRGCEEKLRKSYTQEPAQPDQSHNQ